MKIFVPKNEIILPDLALDVVYAPDLSEWINNQGYVRRMIIPRLVPAPKGFELMPDPKDWTRNLTRMVEDAEYSRLLSKIPRLSRATIERMFP